MVGGMNTSFIKGVPAKTAWLVIGTIALTLCFSLAVLLPKYLGNKKINQKIIAQTILLEKQTHLFPLFTKADKIADLNFLPKLPFPDREPLKRDQINKLSTVFNRLAAQHNLVLSGNRLDLKKVQATATKEKISIELNLSGDFSNFREFLISVGGLPYFDKVEKITIQAIHNSNKQYKARIRINIDK